MKKILTFTLLLIMSLTASATLEKKSEGGWNEAAWMEFTGLSDDYEAYHAYLSSDGEKWTALDAQLVRSYGSYGRVDALGLSAGSYMLKVVPVRNGVEVANEAACSEMVEVRAFSRSGYAHHNATAGIGAYNNDGTLKTGARIIYVTASTAKTGTLEMETDKGKYETRTGLQNILKAYEKGSEQRPLAIRILGTLTKNDMDALGSSAIGLQVKGKSQAMNLTLEGVGNDATLYGFGVLARNCRYVEFRNFAIMLHPEDGMSFDTNNEHIWGHHLDIFYGQNKGGDKAKGDGSFDVKGTFYATVDNVHYWDSGKCNLNSNGDEVDFVTYHHNWYDHSDSRHPRVRKSQHLHVYNNYYDGNAKYGIGSTTGSCIFSENNYFRNCKYPMLISMQGSDVNNGVGSSSETKGTFSSEAGGIIKAFGNYITGEKKFQPYNANDAVNAIHFDAFVANSREEKLPETVKTLKGGTGYNNFDTASDFYTYTPEAAENIPASVTGTYGAGRCQKGDFSFAFNNSIDDTASDINLALEEKLKTYSSAFVKIIGNQSSQADPGTGDNPSDNPGDNPGDTPETTTVGICHFTDKKPSLDNVKVTGNYSNSKGTVEYEGKTYTIALKMETSTEVTITPAENGTVTLIFGGTTVASGKKVKVNGESAIVGTDERHSFEVNKGSIYTIKKGDSINLFLIVITSNSSTSGIATLSASSESGNVYTLQGVKVKGQKKGETYIKNGKKYIIR